MAKINKVCVGESLVGDGNEGKDRRRRDGKQRCQPKFDMGGEPAEKILEWPGHPAVQCHEIPGGSKSLTPSGRRGVPCG